jgi:hypothetical protein
MSLGIFSNTGMGGSELSVTTQMRVVTTIPEQTSPQGQTDFLKRSTGDTIYIGLCGKKPTASNYDIILTDSIPFYDIQGIPLGDISAVGTAATGLLSITIFSCNR